jgi:hypothetical protein
MLQALVLLRVRRHRLRLLGAWALVVALGLASRTAAGRVALPRFVTEYAGDTLWAAMAYLGVLLLAPGMRVRHAAAIALGFAFLVELSQLVHAPWLDALRATRLGALALGQGFLASDFVCYAVGVALAAGTDRLFRRGSSVATTTAH